MRAEILSLLSGQKTDRPPIFSGLIHITAEGLAQEGLAFHEVHQDARKMARAAASTFHLAGMPSAALPLDLCSPAEALGASLNYHENGGLQFPQPAKPLFASTKLLNETFSQGTDFIRQGRLPLICEAIQLLREDVGSRAVISGILPGPYTLLLYVVEPGTLFAEMKREPRLVLDALAHLASFLSQLGSAYRQAGADFITLHEMGGSPGFLGPARFEQFVFPAVKKVIGEVPGPVVLSVCGNTNKSMDLLAQTGARAISVDQTNDLSASRAILEEMLLFGNLDPVQTLAFGNASDIENAVRSAIQAGVDAVWPGCDLMPQTPIQHLQAFLAG